MNDELIDILNNDGSFQKVASKSEAHKYGWLHASVHIWFYTSDGNLLFQKRSSNKKVFPNLWDVSVAGHIGAGEKPIASAIREIQEEIGIDIIESELQFITSYREFHEHSSELKDHEIHYTYICQLNTELSKLKLQLDEVAEVKLESIQRFEQSLEKNEFKSYVPHNLDYYNLIIKSIKNVLKIN